MEIYGKEIEELKTQLIRINNYSSTIDPSFSQWYLANQLLNEHEQYQTFSYKLQQEFLRIQPLVSEANIISNEMQQQPVVYRAILQIPISYFKPSERTINNLCEVAIQVKQEDSVIQIWDIEKFEWKFNAMKDIYQTWKTSENPIRNQSFFDKESETLIGVANIYLKALFYNSKLDYIVPIINTRGEISGSLHAILDQTESSSMKTLSDFQINSTTRSSMSEGINADIDEQSLSNSQPSLEDEGIDEFLALSNGKNDEITIKFAIKEVRDLPATNAEHVICRYTFINPKLDQTVISLESSDTNLEQKPRLFSFNHENEYTFPINDHFLSTCFESAVSIEVWYQYKSQLPSTDTTETNELNQQNIKVREIAKQWKSVKRHVHFSVEIHELDTMGQWAPVEVDAQEQILSGGLYRLKQGQTKHLVAQLRILPRADSLPLSIRAIRSVEIGSISTRKIGAPRQLDSYQDEDLLDLKGQWLKIIEKHKLHLESQVNFLNEQTNKTPDDIHKERILLEQLVRLAEEQNIAVFPPSGSGIPGSPAGWQPPPTVEMHRPLIFLNIGTSNDTAGLQAILIEENKSRMFALPLIQNASDDLHAVALWDPAIHESPAMNQVTPPDTLIYLIVKIVVILSEPVEMEVILRKRIAVSIAKTEGWWTGKTFRNLLGYKTYKGTSVLYELVSTIPKTLHAIEDQNKTDFECLPQDLIEKYIQYASAIDSVLLLDKLRQEVLLAENSAKQQTIGQTTNAPNITSHRRHTHLFHSPANTRRDNQLSAVANEPELSLNPTELNDSTLKDHQPPDEEQTLELEYPAVTSQSAKERNSNNNNADDLSIGCRVIVNTGHSIYEKPGIIRFMGEISNKKDIWYGIELDEAVGKNNGSLDGHIYFQCLDKHGVFVRREKIKLID